MTKEIQEYIEQAIEAFKADPPDSAFQNGYLAALLALYKEFIQDDAKPTIH